LIKIKIKIKWLNLHRDGRIHPDYEPSASTVFLEKDKNPIKGVVSSTHAICPCSIQSGRLTCSEGLVNNFPEDLLAEGCTLDFDSVWALEIKNQPLRILKDNAFAKFSNLLQISMPFNQIEFIQRDAFAGLSSVTGLILENNAQHLGISVS